jgi:organic radical activating enzyme
MNETDDGRVLASQYAEAMRPYNEGGGPVPAAMFATRSWRYFVEVNSGCNLRCVLCSCGNREGYEHVNAVMDMGLLERVLDKIKLENPNAIVMPYGNSEPFLHPKLPECVAAIKARGLRCEVASNLNHINRLDEFLAAGCDALFISVSGFTQDTYGKSHHGGDIEVVKSNMLVLKEALKKCERPPHTMVHYHMYRDSLGEQFDKMKAFTEEQLGFQFINSWARCITMESTIQYLRHMETERTGTVRPIPIGADGKDWNKLLPPINPSFIKTVERLSISPVEATEMYAQFPIQSVCPIGDIFTFIRHDGAASLCACVSDRRLTLGGFLDLTQEQLSVARRGHPICSECLRYRMNLYFHVVDGSKFNLK